MNEHKLQHKVSQQNLQNKRVKVCPSKNILDPLLQQTRVSYKKSLSVCGIK
jgi:hypothetical protein